MVASESRAESQSLPAARAPRLTVTTTVTSRTAIRSGTHRIAKLDSFMRILASLDGHDMYKTKTNRYYFESHDFQLVAFLELYLF